jgi:Flp pilus assembly CpaE family ATPase
MHCANHAKTLAEAAPRSVMRKDLQKLATDIQAGKDEEKK